MLHVHDFLTANPPRLAARSILPVSPATYLRLRREAAGLTVRQLADRLMRYRAQLLAEGTATHPAYTEARDAVALVELLEREGARAQHRATVEALAACMPLDVDVYFQLATEPARSHPRVCHGCGCSTHDACQHDSYGSCAWVSPTQCSHCELRGRA